MQITNYMPMNQVPALWTYTYLNLDESAKIIEADIPHAIH
jgi:hypothetical protein